MRPQHIVTLVSLFVTAPTGVFLPTPDSLHFISPVLAQAPDSRSAEAGRLLLEQGSQQLQTRQYQAAIKSYEQARAIFHATQNSIGEARALNGLGRAYHSLSQEDKAIQFWQQAITIYRQLGDREGEAWALTGLGLAYSAQLKSGKAIEVYQQALPMFQQVGNPIGEALALDGLGRAYHSLSQYDKAIQFWQPAITIYRRLGEHEGEALALESVGATYRSLLRTDKAIQFLQPALTIYRRLGKRSHEARTLTELGLAYSVQLKSGKAIEFYQQALTIYRELGDRKGEALALESLDIAYRSLQHDKVIGYTQWLSWALFIWGAASLALGYYAKTKPIKFAQQSLAIAHILKNRRGEGAALGSLGDAYRNLGNHAQAIEYYQQSLVIFRKIKDRKGEGNALNNLGIAYRSLDDYTKAIEYYQQSLVIFRKIRNRKGEGYALGNLGNAYRYLGNYAGAIEYAQQNLVIAHKIKDRKGKGNALNSLSSTYYFLGNYAQAIEYGQQSVAIARKIKDRSGEGNALGSLGNAYRKLGYYTQAIECLQQHLAITRKIKDREEEGTALGNLGNAYHSLGNYAKAIECYQQDLAITRKIKDRDGEGQALGNLGIVYSCLGDDAQAIEYIQQGLVIFREIKDLQDEGLALNNLGWAFSKASNFAEAEKLLMDGIQIWESMRQMLGNNDANKVSIFEEQARTYRLLQLVLVAQNKPIAALEIAERGRARAFIDLLTQRLSSGSANPVIVAVPNQDRIRQVAKAQNATLVQYSIIYDDFQIQGRLVGLESALYIWVIQPTSEITFRQVDLKPLWQKHKASLADLIIGNQEFLAVRSRDMGGTKHQPDLPTLHQLLIDPIASLLPKDPNAHVIFIPQRLLFQVPFPALQDTDGTYLIQKHTILTSPSIQVLSLTREIALNQIQTRSTERSRRSPNSKLQTALVVGNPIMSAVSLYPGEPKQPLPPLPGAEVEAKAIAPLLNTQAIIGAHGTKAAIKQKMPQASIIHLATHGILDDIRGLGSAIALTPSNGDDGLLTAEEILDMNLQANLVVLSACHTGQGKITGDGVIGLSRALISAGVPSVIVSLWAVPDAPTAELMQTFYQNLQKQPDKAQALRQAMLTTMKTHPQPRDWAAFTLIGEAE